MATAQRPFRFGAYVRAQVTRASADHETDHGFGAAGWRDLVHKVEDLGFQSLALPDHFGHQPAPLAAMMSALDATSTLRLTTGVLDNDFRHPLVLAREIATMDVLSGGRVELGLGAGWLRSDYDESGIAYDPPGTRISRLDEAAQVIQGLWRPGRFRFSGRFYAIDHELYPRPVQQPIPLMLGGGSPRVLRLAGRRADVVGINFNLAVGATMGPGRALRPGDVGTDGTAASVAQKVAWVREGAQGRTDDVELSLTAMLTKVGPDCGPVLQALATEIGLSENEVAQMPALLVGSRAQVTEKVLGLRETFGITTVVVEADAVEAFAPIVAELR